MNEFLGSQKVVFSAFFDSPAIPSEDKIRFLLDYTNKMAMQNNTPDSKTASISIPPRSSSGLTNDKYEGSNLSQLNIARLPVQPDIVDKKENNAYNRYTAAASQTAEPELKSLHVATAPSVSKPQLLLIEDDIILQKTIARTFTKKGCQVVAAVDSVSKAREAIKARSYDLVVCDLGLLEGTGLDVIAWVKSDKTHPNQNTPFVVLTANNDDAMRKSALAGGFLNVLQKPLADEVAQNIIDVYVHEKKKPHRTAC